jgi:hypothetical protein
VYTTKGDTDLCNNCAGSNEESDGTCRAGCAGRSGGRKLRRHNPPDSSNPTNSYEPANPPEPPNQGNQQHRHDWHDRYDPPDWGGSHNPQRWENPHNRRGRAQALQPAQPTRQPARSAQPAAPRRPAQALPPLQAALTHPSRLPAQLLQPEYTIPTCGGGTCTPVVPVLRVRVGGSM